MMSSWKGPSTEIEDVVDDDVGSGLAERLDVGCETRLPAEGRREVKLRARGQVVDDLEHGRPLVAFSKLSGQHRHPGRQVSSSLPRGQGADPVREHPDPDAGAVDAVGGAGRVGPVGNVALGGAGPRLENVDQDVGGKLPRPFAGDCLVGCANGPNRIVCGQRLHLGQRHLRPDGPVALEAAEDPAAQFPDALQDLRGDLGPEVDRHHPIRSRPALRLLPLLQQLRVHLALGRGPPLLGLENRLDLPYGPGRQRPAGPVHYLLVGEPLGRVAGLVADRLSARLLRLHLVADRGGLALLRGRDQRQPHLTPLHRDLGDLPTLGPPPSP